MHKTDFFIDFIFTILISAFIGLAFALVVTFIHQRTPVLPTFLRGILIGIIVGTASHISFAFVYLKLKINEKICFLIVFIVTGITTLISLILSGLRNIVLLLSISLSAGTIGLIIAIILCKFNI